MHLTPIPITPYLKIGGGGLAISLTIWLSVRLLTGVGELPADRQARKKFIADSIRTADSVVAALQDAAKPQEQSKQNTPQPSTNVSTLKGSLSSPKKPTSTSSKTQDKLASAKTPNTLASTSKKVDKTTSTIKPADSQKPTSPSPDKSAADGAAWKSANSKGTVSAYGNYLSQYPNGKYAGDAREAKQLLQARIDKLLKQAKVLEEEGKSALAQKKQDEANSLK